MRHTASVLSQTAFRRWRHPPSQDNGLYCIWDGRAHGAILSAAIRSDKTSGRLPSGRRANLGKEFSCESMAHHTDRLAAPEAPCRPPPPAVLAIFHDYAPTLCTWRVSWWIVCAHSGAAIRLI